MLGQIRARWCDLRHSVWLVSKRNFRVALLRLSFEAGTTEHSQRQYWELWVCLRNTFYTLQICPESAWREQLCSSRTPSTWHVFQFDAARRRPAS